VSSQLQLDQLLDEIFGAYHKVINAGKLYLIFFSQKNDEIFGAYHKVINAGKLVYDKLKFEHDELHKKCDNCNNILLIFLL
jgi:hypothetical protein